MIRVAHHLLLVALLFATAIFASEAMSSEQGQQVPTNVDQSAQEVPNAPPHMPGKNMIGSSRVRGASHGTAVNQHRQQAESLKPTNKDSN